jgi:predicted permease
VTDNALPSTRPHFAAEFRQDLGYGLRTLRRNPGFTTVILFTLALGIGANTAIFTLINAVLLRPLDLPSAERLVAVGNTTRVNSASLGTARGDLYSYELYKDLRADNRFLSGLLADGRTGRLDVITDRAKAGAAAEHPRGRLVSGNYFSVLGVPAALGRMLSEGDEGATGASPVVVISYDYWTRRFAADRNALNRTITVNGAPYTIVGVARPGFNGIIVGTTTDLWIPLSMQPQVMGGRDWIADRGASFVLLMGRLAPGVTIEQARPGIAELTKRALSAPVYAKGPFSVTSDQVKAMVIPVASGSRGFSRVRADFRAPLLTLMAGVGLLLLIVCANVANLLLARAVARDREIGVRLALGAARTRLVRQLLTENAALALGGAALGLAFAWWASRLLLTMASGGPNTIPVGLAIDLPVLGFTGAIAVVTVGLFGLAPALRSTRLDLATTMRSSARAIGPGMSGTSTSGSRLPFGQLLIVSQVALSMLLLVSAGLLVRSLGKLDAADVGLDRAHLIVADLDPDRRRYPPVALAALDRELLARVATVPGVTGVTMSENGLFSGTESGTTLQAEGFTPSAAGDTVAAYDQVGPGYFKTIGARLIAGRDFAESDNEQAAPTVIVNESLARFYFGSAQAAIGKMLRFGTDALPIVGVVADIQDHDLKAAPVRRLYASYFHAPVNALGAPGPLRLEVRTSGDPTPAVRAVRAAVAAVDPDMRILDVSTLAQTMANSLAQERLVTRLALGFGAVALILSAVGLYGVMSFTIARRTGEIGLRMALGAQGGDVVRLVFGEALKIVAVGVVVGVPMALGGAKILRDQLHGVSAADPAAMGGALVAIAVSAVVAIGVPVWRAARVDPLVALRRE